MPHINGWAVSATPDYSVSRGKRGLPQLFIGVMEAGMRRLEG